MRKDVLLKERWAGGHLAQEQPKSLGAKGIA